MIALVFEDDGTPDITEVKFYIDGVLDTVSSQTSADMDTTTDSFVSMMCGYGWGYMQYYGYVGEYGVFHRALTVNELKNIYEMGRP